MSGPFLTVAQVAELLAVDPSKVLHWLNSGQLVGIDVAENRGRRKRWRISREALDEFLSARQSVTAAPKPKRNCRPQRDIKEFV